jgi:hypothetical protein
VLKHVGVIQAAEHWGDSSALQQGGMLRGPHQPDHVMSRFD